ncbi:Uncharacterised protein [Vibrio cholerae]|nr:Uncharacterised protein [Vibrio cholerae]
MSRQTPFEKSVPRLLELSLPYWVAQSHSPRRREKDETPSYAASTFQCQFAPWVTVVNLVDL